MIGADDSLNGQRRYTYRSQCLARLGERDAPIDREDPKARSLLLEAMLAEIDAARCAAGLSYFDLAIEADLNPDTLRFQLNGRSRNPKFETIERMLAALGLALSEIARRAEMRLGRKKEQPL